MPLGTVSPIFYNNILGLSVHAASVGNSTLQLQQRGWYVPNATLWSGNPHDVTGMKAAFDRDALNSNHTFAINTAGTDGGGRLSDCRGIKLQVDYMACMERAYRSSVASGIRCALHAAGRKIAHAKDGGIYTGGIIKYVQDALSSGYNGSDAGFDPVNIKP